MFRRHRRLRENEAIRAMVRETVIREEDFIYPMFVVEGENIKEEISSLPGNYHYSIDRLEELVEEVKKSGIKGIMIFGVPDHKDECGSAAFDDNGIVQKGIRRLRELMPELYIVADVCMCQYTSHGHCGIIHGHNVDNDESLKYLAKYLYPMQKLEQI